MKEVDSMELKNLNDKQIEAVKHIDGPYIYQKSG